jgi:DNA-binding CsgD family transcriptional regulator
MPSEAHFLSALITAIYDAALDQSLWPPTLKQICAFIRGPAAMIFAHDGALKAGYRFHSWGDDPEYTRLYFERYAAINPVNPAQLLLDLGEVKAALDLVPRRELMETRFYREWAKPQGYVDNVFAIVDKSATSYAALAVTRDEQTGAVDDQARRRMSLLAPHVRRAVLIGNVIDLRQAEASMFAEMVGSLASAVFFVDANARILFANAAGQDVLGDRKVVSNVEGTFAALDPQADEALRSVFAASANGDMAVGTGGVAVLLSVSLSERWLAHVLPMTAGVRQQARTNYAAAAAVFVRKASLDTPSSMETVAKLYRLTASELRVLQSVIETRGVRAVANALGLSEATVKTHLQRLFNKTGTRRQSDLIKLVAGASSPFARSEA